MIEKWIQADVLSQSPYQVKTTKFQIKLNQNESPWDWPTDIKRTISRRILSGGWNRYPDLIQVSTPQSTLADFALADAFTRTVRVLAIPGLLASSEQC